MAGEEEEKECMWQKKRRVCMRCKYAAFTKQISSAQKILHNSSMGASYYSGGCSSFLRRQYPEHNVDRLLAAE